jgi:glutamate mutase epsilon subunit
MRNHHQRVCRLETRFQQSTQETEALAQARALQTISDEHLQLLHDVSLARHAGPSRLLTTAGRSACAAYTKAFNREFARAV